MGSDASHNDSKLLNNDLKHMESITAAATSRQSPVTPSVCTNNGTHNNNNNSSSSSSDGSNTSIAKINDSVDKSSDDGSDAQQVKSETIPKTSPAHSSSSGGGGGRRSADDNEIGLRSESETNNNDNETVNSKNDDDIVGGERGGAVKEERKCSLESEVKKEVESSTENNSQSESGSYKENQHLQSEAPSSLLPRIANHHFIEETPATGKKKIKLRIIQTTTMSFAFHFYEKFMENYNF